jgi:hypothetical protein
MYKFKIFQSVGEMVEWMNLNKWVKEPSWVLSNDQIYLVYFEVEDEK